MEQLHKDLLLKLFGAHLKKVREEKNISLRVLEQLTDVDHSQIHRIEKGKSSPSLITLISLAKGLEIDLKKLVDFE